MIGAPLRYLTDRAVQNRRDTLFPWGTFSVNVAGCLILGGLTSAGLALPTGVLAFHARRGPGCLVAVRRRHEVWRGVAEAG